MSPIKRFIDRYPNLFGILSVPLTFAIFLAAAGVGQVLGMALRAL